MRLDFALPEFLRIIWSSPEAREVWEERIHRICSAWIEIERLAVATGVKPATLQMYSPEELPEITRWALKNQLVCIPLAQQGISDGYLSGSRAYEPGRSWGYRAIIAKPELAALFLEFWDSNNDEGIGAALGFPECCRKFFLKYWKEEGWRDLTYPMVALFHVGEYKADGRYTVCGPVECNILLRWLGLRFVSHLPCSFNCAATERLGTGIRLLANRAGYGIEMNWLKQILNWPIRWSSLHGVGIVTTPVFRLVFDSTALAERVIIDRDGPDYPDEAARGIEFPFREQHRVSIVKNEHSDNGFASRVAMEEGHQMILSKLSGLPTVPKTILDLGCGNGILLEKIGKIFPEANLAGIEINESKHQKAARRLLSDISLGNIMDYSLWDKKYDVILVAEQRLEEDSDAMLLDKLFTRGTKTLIYNYNTRKVSL